MPSSPRNLVNWNDYAQKTRMAKQQDASASAMSSEFVLEFLLSLCGLRDSSGMFQDCRAGAGYSE